MSITKSYLNILRVGMTLVCLALLTAPPTVQAAPTVAGVKISLETVTGGTTVTGVVTLVETVGGTGVAVLIKSDNAAVRVGPNTSQVSSSSSVTVPVGAKVAQFQIVTSAVGSTTGVIITASLPNSNRAAKMIVNPPTLKSVTVSAPTFSASQFPGGAGANLIVSLTGPAPPEFIVKFDIPTTLVNIRPSNSITVREGSTGHSQPLNTTPVDKDTPVNGFVTGGGATLPVNFTLVPPSAVNLMCGAPIFVRTVVGGATVPSCIVGLNAPAPATGIAIPLSSSMISAVPSTYSVRGGQRESEPFSISTTPVSVSTPVTFSSAGKQFGTLTVLPPAVKAMVFTLQNPVGGTEVTASVILNGPAPVGGINVPVSSGNTAAATVPGSVSIAAGRDSGSVLVATLKVTNDTTVSITAGATSAPLIVRAGP